jgi:hypothetical protein
MEKREQESCTEIFFAIDGGEEKIRLAPAGSQPRSSDK